MYMGFVRTLTVDLAAGVVCHESEIHLL